MPYTDTQIQQLICNFLTQAQYDALVLAGTVNQNEMYYVTDAKEGANNITITPVGNIAATNVQAAIEELDSEKQAKTLYFANKTVAVGDWVADTTYADYGYKAVISCANVTSTMLSEVTFAPIEADSGNYAAVCLSGTGTVTIYAKAVPSGTITIPTIKSEVTI